MDLRSTSKVSQKCKHSRVVLVHTLQVVLMHLDKVFVKDKGGPTNDLVWWAFDSVGMGNWWLWIVGSWQWWRGENSEQTRIIPLWGITIFLIFSFLMLCLWCPLLVPPFTASRPMLLFSYFTLDTSVEDFSWPDIYRRSLTSKLQYLESTLEIGLGVQYQGCRMCFQRQHLRVHNAQCSYIYDTTFVSICLSRKFKLFS